MQLTKEQVEAIFAEIRPQIIEDLKKSVIASAEWQTRETTREYIAAELKAYMTAEVIPALRERLAESREGIIAACIPAAEGMATALSAALLETLTKNLAEGSYKRGKIFEELFK